MKQNTQRTIFANIDKYLFLNGIGQRAFCSRIGMSPSAWTRKKKGETALTIPELERSAQVLNVSIEQLLTK